MAGGKVLGITGGKVVVEKTGKIIGIVATKEGEKILRSFGGEAVLGKAGEHVGKTAVKQGEKVVKVLNNTIVNAKEIAHTPGLAPAAKKTAIDEALNPPPLPPAETGVKSWATKKWEAGKEYAGKKYDEFVGGKGANTKVNTNTARGLKESSKVGKEKTVLGKHPEYLDRADELNAHRLDIPSNIWKKMSEPERWEANRRFLDRVIARGDEIILATPVKDTNTVTGFFRKELDYLISNGYRLNSDGTKMIK